MALTKYFVILFLVYLNFDISPLNSAAIPERYDTSDTVNKNDEATTESSENYSTTLTNDDDIEKIFESYENQYIKNSNWFNGDTQLRNIKDNENDQKSIKVKSEESNPRESETTEPTADDVVETIHNIMDDKIETKTNRTDRTIVVVVTTNVFNVNGSDESAKRQHTLLSFGTPGMIPKPPSTDATLAMHNKITTEFFNSNPSPISEQPGVIKTNDESVNENDTEGNEFHEENNFGEETVAQETEEEREFDITTTEKPKTPEEDYNFNGIDIRRLRDFANSPSSDYNSAIVEGRNFADTFSNENSNDVLRIMKIIPSRDDEMASLSKPFEIPIQEPPDSSLMEAMENILDTDVRKAFERDIPETRHIPLDINIEEEALYAPLKDLSEYIVEEIPVNYDILKENENYKGDGSENKAEVAEKWKKEKDLVKPLDNNQVHEEETFAKPTERSDDLVDELITQSHTTDDVQTSTVTTPAAERSFQSNADNQHIEDITSTEKDSLTTTSNYFLDKGTESFQHSDHHDDSIVRNEENILSQKLLSQHKISEKDETSNLDDLSEENDKISDLNEVINTTEIPSEEVDGNSIRYSTEHVETDAFTPVSSISIETDRRLRHADDKKSELEDVNLNELDDSHENLNYQKETLFYDKNSTLLRIGDEAIVTEEKSSTTIERVEQNIASEVVKVEQFEEAIDNVLEPNPQPLVPTSLYDSDEAFDEQNPTSVKPDDVDIVSEGIKVDQEASDQYKKTYEIIDKVLISNPRVFEKQHMSSGEKVVVNESLKVVEGTSGRNDQSKSTIDNVLKSNLQSIVPTLLDNSDDTDISKELSSNTLKLTLEDVEFPAVKPDEAISEHLQDKTIGIDKNDNLNYNEERSSTTTKPNGEDVVSEVVRVDEETTEQHQIIKKPGVDGNDSVEIKAIKANNNVSNELLETKTASFQSRAFIDNDEAVDPLRTLVEGVELTADITKTFDNFQSFANPNSAIHFAANQVVETKDDMELVDNNVELNSSDPSEWYATARFIYIGAGVLSIGLIVLLVVFAVVRFRQFKRNILFSC